MIYCVDLDGTLITYDMSVISFLRSVKSNWALIPRCLAWYLSGGRARVKTKIAQIYQFNPKHLPYNEELISYLKTIAQEHPEDKMYLVSGSDDGIVKRIASGFEFFAGGFGTNPKTNLTGRRKLAFIEKQFPGEDVCYIGNSKVDVEVWKGVSHGIVVSDNEELISKAKECTKVLKIFPKAQGTEINGGM